LKFDAKPCRTAEVPLIEPIQADGISGILPPKVEREVVANACQNEWARHLGDVMTRRTSWRYYHREHLAIANQVAEWMAGELNWSGEQKQAELDRYERVTTVD
jgi:glycerol-3-phosphate dehydrogenase